ncbi:MAG: zinc-ribbon domain-containing protein [Anaerolineales bacterium]|nr:zinc-ribbon domain-containing protein [Anaerolineales bacterium]
MGKPLLADAYPEIAAQWHPAMNGDLTPKDVSIGSSRKRWWICPKVPEHVWDARVNARVKGRGCPYCSGKRKFGYEYKSFAEAHPEVVVEWHPTKNGDLTPDKVPEGSSIVVWWKCSSNPKHEWEAKVQYRKSLTGSGSCPICRGRAISFETSLAGKYPALAEQWHRAKNGDLKPTDFFPNSKKKVWWVCKKDPSHEWQAQIKSRIETSGECPTCKRQNSKQLPMLSEYDSELAKEWHPKKNEPLTPDQVRAGAEIKVWWLCKNDQSHE